MSKLKTILARMSRASARKTLKKVKKKRSQRYGPATCNSSKARRREYLLPAHTIPWSGGKRLESLLVVFQEPRVEQVVGLGQETLWVEDARLEPVGGVVLHVLKIDTNDRLRGEEKVRKWALI